MTIANSTAHLWLPEHLPRLRRFYERVRRLRRWESNRDMEAFGDSLRRAEYLAKFYRAVGQEATPPELARSLFELGQRLEQLERVMALEKGRGEGASRQVSIQHPGRREAGRGGRS